MTRVWIASESWTGEVFVRKLVAHALAPLVFLKHRTTVAVKSDMDGDYDQTRPPDLRLCILATTVSSTWASRREAQAFREHGSPYSSRHYPRFDLLASGN
ncbi:uncharacterized protein MYCFIDRAFT_173348 [Pseudocercospora fijiensis CIRAD86]|uniref:Uncharacterized protein n=1 Tax=Pseudocercospora fijiensis (strain CIRAD86) TaxID=383855 RepID=M2ZZK3_PSEFD|nr:uncharacterized protein MYCFIDRAFT_173348 [Pseudocercospora fijiensis CIRAD86]EME84339.1 hypothetical protein MYCFIDRAFT_173348 [Pseudocercospora fijiensis CIRAD86]